MARIVVITNGNYFANIILEKLLAHPEYQIGGVVVINGDYSGNTGLRALKAFAKTTTLPYVIYKLLVFAFFKAMRLVSKRPWEVTEALENAGIPYLESGRVNSKAVADFVESSNPDLLVSVSCPQRIKSRLLSIPTTGSINIHSSALPQYAGLAPYFWTLANKERTTGITVHYMTQEFDEGRILEQAKVGIADRESAFGLFRRLAEIGNVLLPLAAEKALAKHPGYAQDLGQRSYASHPSWHAYRALRRNGHRLIRLRDLWAVLRSPAVVSAESCEALRVKFADTQSRAA